MPCGTPPSGVSLALRLRRSQQGARLGSVSVGETLPRVNGQSGARKWFETDPFAPPRGPSRRRAARGQRLWSSRVFGRCFTGKRHAGPTSAVAPADWASQPHGPNWRSGCGPGGAHGLSSRHEPPPSLGRQHSCAQAAPPLEPRRRRLSGSGDVIPRRSLPRSRRSAIAIPDGPRSKMPSLAWWLTSLLTGSRSIRRNWTSLPGLSLALERHSRERRTLDASGCLYYRGRRDPCTWPSSPGPDADS